MENAELVALIKEKFSKGERREDISAELQNDGWDVGDIDLAITHIQHEALKQIPVVSWIIKKFEILEAKTANASPKALAIPSTTPVSIPVFAPGTITLDIVCHLVAPSP